MSCMLKFLHVSGRPVRKSGKNEKGTRRNHGGVFRVRDGSKISVRCAILPGRGDPLEPKIPRFFGNFRRFWVGWNPKHGKSAFCTRQKSNRLVRFVKPREVVASIASCARPVSGYRARVPHRYVPARKRFPLARAVRRPSVDRRPTPAPGMTRFVAEDTFSFSFPATWSASTTNVSASPPRREAGAAAPAQSARARRVCACLATRPRRPRESDPLPRRSPPRPQSRACCLEKAGGRTSAFPSARRFRNRKGRTATSACASRDFFFHAQKLP